MWPISISRHLLTKCRIYNILSLVNDNAVILSDDRVPDSDPALSATQVADALGVTSVTIQRWARAGFISAEKLGGKTGAYVIRRSEVERLKAKRHSRTG